HAAEGGGDGRAVAGRVVELLPDQFAGSLVEGGQRVAVGAAGVGEEQVALDQRRERHAPAQVRRLELLQQVLAPDLFPLPGAREKVWRKDLLEEFKAPNLR